MAEILADIQRWTEKRRSSRVLQSLRGETRAAAAARKHGIRVAEVEAWKQKFTAGAENALRSRPRDEDGMKDTGVKRLKQKIGELVMDLHIYKEAIRGYPFGRKMLDE